MCYLFTQQMYAYLEVHESYSPVLSGDCVTRMDVLAAQAIAAQAVMAIAK